jgi:23S rRNA (uracil1939-C5)-methyltransferase
MAESVRVRPERFVAGGAALARDADGRVLFVRGAVPGDDVTVAVTERRAGFGHAVVDEVHAPGPDRVLPPCPQRLAGCGGCDWQHVAVPAQLPAKLEIVRDALRRTARLPGADVRAGAGVPPSGYRTTVRVVGDQGGRAAFRHERSHDTVAAAGCLVTHPALHAALADVELTPGLELTLRVSAATGEMTAAWDASRGTVSGLPPECRTGRSAHLTEVVAGHRLRVSAGAFFQSGPDAAELLVDALRRAAPELSTARSVVDAYAGVGLFAVAAVPARAHVTTIESSAPAVADARVNLAGRSATIVEGQTGRWNPPAGARFDVVIADPSRTGLAKPGVNALARAAAPLLVLVSCDPASLARDTTLLREHGYEHAYSEVLDLFAHTHHAEAVTRFVRAAPPD